MMHLFRFLEIPQEHIYYADSISVFLASWRKFTQIYWILCLRRLSGDVSKAAKLPQSSRTSSSTPRRRTWSGSFQTTKVSARIKCRIRRKAGGSLPALRMFLKWWKPNFLRWLWCSVWSPMRAMSCPHTSYRSGKGSTPTPTSRSWLSWITCKTGGRPWVWYHAYAPCDESKYVHGLALRALPRPRHHGLLAAPTLLRWIILFGATSRHISIDVPKPIRPVWLHPYRSTLPSSPWDLVIKACSWFRGRIEVAMKA